jgi:hypothetical protein
MPDDEKLTLADPKDIADTIAFSLKFEAGSASTTPTHLWPRLSRSVSSDIWSAADSCL